MVHGFHNDFTRHRILIDLEVRVFEVRGLSKVHLAAVLKALLYKFGQKGTLKKHAVNLI